MSMEEHSLRTETCIACALVAHVLGAWAVWQDSQWDTCQEQSQALQGSSRGPVFKMEALLLV